MNHPRALMIPLLLSMALPARAALIIDQIGDPGTYPFDTSEYYVSQIVTDLRVPCLFQIACKLINATVPATVVTEGRFLIEESLMGENQLSCGACVFKLNRH